MSERIVPPVVIERQRLAAEPRASAWVSANAGSGKTTVLAHRVIRLLLAGAKPARLLCLTFTKAAAANMQIRVFRDLGDWALLPDDKLSSAIAALEGRVPDAERLRRARRLFAEAIETPGGLKILTIHGFCERLLRLFPFEANVPAGFEVLEQRAGRRLLDRARAAVIAAGLNEPSGDIAKALARVTETARDDAFTDLMDEVTRNREKIAALIEASGGADKAADRLAAALGLDPGETTAAVEVDMLARGLPASEWRSVATALREAGLKTDAERAADFEAAAVAVDLSEKLAAYLSVFTTQKGEIRASVCTKGVAKAYPALAARLEAERLRLETLIARRKATSAVERTRAILRLSAAMIEAYVAGKARDAALDFDDLVVATRNLIERAGAEWVLYKLDQGIDHILVDEAQDTSPDQWRIVEKLADEFFAGAGARVGPPRTLFAVGDEKQSIFSFQGAAPEAFAAMRRKFEARATAAGLDFTPVELTYSFRSTHDVLSAVDAVFEVPDNRRGLTFDDVPPVHLTVRGRAVGRVEVWPVEKPVDRAPVEPWDAPFDETSSEAPAQRLARRLATAIARWTTRGDPDTGKRYDPGDIMILVRTRNALFHAIIRALKRARVPVAGADRLVLTEHIAVMDLIALARFALRPEDDLTLATLLKTPLVGFDDDDLIALAPGRPGSLWAALEAREDARSQAAAALLRRWIEEATSLSPFAFYAGVLARDGGRRAFLARLGSEAADALDEFLAAALDFESAATPSLEGFVAWLDEVRTEVKRDMDVARGEVRVMTTHGAKGLEAKVVILADTCSAPDGRHDPKLLFLKDPAAGEGAPPLAIWVTGKTQDPPLAAARRQALAAGAEAEHRRLLYVAMTRAEDRLIVAGYDGARARPASAWYDMIEGALRDKGARSEPMPDGEGERLVWSATPVPEPSPDAGEAMPDAVIEPGWLRMAAAPERVAGIVLKPSGVEAGASAATLLAKAASDGALQRGRLIHRLLQSLPDVEGDRREAALRFLLRAAPTEEASHAALIDGVMAILEAPAFAPLFAPGSRAEVPIVGRLPRAGRPDLIVSGRIDRLAVTADDVLIVDFKTNIVMPAPIADAPPDYVAQLSLYAAVLGRVFAGRTVRAALAWTQGPSLMEVPRSMLDRALASLV